jgi:fibronectin type 3 domain-containing protein
VTHSGIQLNWTAPKDTVPNRSVTYRVFRAEVQEATAHTPQPGSTPNAASTNNPLEKIAETPSTSYLDTQIHFGNSYVYSVRSAATVEQQQQLESADSNRVTILARDVFPPEAPAGLIVVFVPAQSGEPAHLELSWNISPETDLAGYYVYRSGQVDVPGTRLNPEPLPTPAFRDMNAVPGRSYFYRVTAVDKSGNESAASESVSGEVPAAGSNGP